MSFTRKEPRHNGTFDAVDNNDINASSKRRLSSRKHHLENRIVIRKVIRPKNPTGSKNDPSSSMRDSLRSYVSQSERVNASFLSASLRSMNEGAIKFSQPIAQDAKDDIDTEADLEHEMVAKMMVYW